MSKETFGIVLGVGSFVVFLALYLIDKSGKALPHSVSIGLLCLLAALGLSAVLLIPWIWSPAQSAERIWRAGLCSAVVLLLVGKFGIWLGFFSPAAIAGASNELVATDQKPKIEQGSNPVVPPVIDAVMMIDSVGEKYINFHVDMENLSQVKITDIGVAFQSVDASSMDMAPQIFRSMSPKDKLSTNVGLFVLNARNYNSAGIFITYSAEIESTARKFTAVYKFLFGLDEAKKKSAIHPDNIVRKEGQESEEERFRDQLNARLSKEEGTIQILLPEITPDGKPNLTRFGDPRTNFLFDTQANLVLFRRLNKSGKWLQVSEAMRNPRMTIGAVHVITVTWNNEGVSLFIDGAKRVQSKPNE